MTGGLVLVLAAIGRNFGAGMTNGLAYVLDESGGLPSRINMEMVTLAPFEGRDESEVQSLLHEHLERTGSARARSLIQRWDHFRAFFRKVVPNTVPDTGAEGSQPRIPVGAGMAAK
jgi:glutamate synthase (NADPH/NADH) large chain/glutamate synthase (ferredoxin)